MYWAITAGIESLFFLPNPLGFCITQTAFLSGLLLFLSNRIFCCCALLPLSGQTKLQRLVLQLSIIRHTSFDVFLFSLPSCCCMRGTGWAAGRPPCYTRAREPSPTCSGGPISLPGPTMWYDSQLAWTNSSAIPLHPSLLSSCLNKVTSVQRT